MPRAIWLLTHARSCTSKPSGLTTAVKSRTLPSGTLKAQPMKPETCPVFECRVGSKLSLVSTPTGAAAGCSGGALLKPAGGASYDGAAGAGSGGGLAVEPADAG